MAGPFVLSMAGGGSARRGRLARRGNARPCGRPGGRASYRIAALWRPQHPGPRTALSLRHGPAARSVSGESRRPGCGPPVMAGLARGSMIMAGSAPQERARAVGHVPAAAPRLLSESQRSRPPCSSAPLLTSES